MRIILRHPLPEHRNDGSTWVPACDVYGAVDRHVIAHAVPPHRATRLIRGTAGAARTPYYLLRTDHPLQQQAPAVIEYNART